MSETNSTLKALRLEKRAVTREMKEKNIRRVSCFNGGHSPESYRLNAELFRLNTLIKTEEKRATAG